MKKMWVCLAAIVIALYLGACYRTKQDSSDDQYHKEESQLSQSTNQVKTNTSSESSKTQNSSTSKNILTTTGPNVNKPSQDNNTGTSSKTGAPSGSYGTTTTSSPSQSQPSSSTSTQTTSITKGLIDQTPVDKEGNNGWSDFQ